MMDQSKIKCIRKYHEDDPMQELRKVRSIYVNGGLFWEADKYRICDLLTPTLNTNCYADTGIRGNLTDKIELKAKGWAYNSYLLSPFIGSFSNNNNVKKGIAIGQISKALCIQYGSKQVKIPNFFPTSGTVDFKLVIENGIITVESDVLEDGVVTYDLSDYCVDEESEVNYYINGSQALKNTIYYGNMRHYTSYIKIWKKGKLTASYIPVYNIRRNLYGMYDLVEREFYPSQGKNDFHCEESTDNYIQDAANYEELDYIESTGVQCIDTEIMLEYGYKYEMEFYYVDFISDENKVFGQGYTVGGTSNNAVQFPRTNNSKFCLYIHCAVNGPYNNSELSPIITTTSGLNKWYFTSVNIVQEGEIYVKELGTDNISTANISSKLPLNFPVHRPDGLRALLFYIYTDTKFEYPAAARVRYLRIWNEKGNLVGDFRPIRSIENDEVCMINVVTNRIYKNIKDGEFIGGPPTGKFY